MVGFVVGLTFLFGFGNVLDLGLRLGVSPWVAPLVAPAVDVSVVALLLGSRELALRGAPVEALRPVHRLLMFTSVVTLALNTAAPLLAEEWGKAAFDAVGPLLLIGWAHVGPALLQAISPPMVERVPVRDGGSAEVRQMASVDPSAVPRQGTPRPDSVDDGELLDRARLADGQHRAIHQRPISAETLRRQLRIGAGRSRSLVARLRSEYAARGDYGSATCVERPHVLGQPAA
jgi:hypothetical protein